MLSMLCACSRLNISVRRSSRGLGATVTLRLHGLGTGFLPVSPLSCLYGDNLADHTGARRCAWFISSKIKNTQQPVCESGGLTVVVYTLVNGFFIRVTEPVAVFLFFLPSVDVMFCVWLPRRSRFFSGCWETNATSNHPDRV